MQACRQDTKRKWPPPAEPRQGHHHKCAKNQFVVPSGTMRIMCWTMRAPTAIVVAIAFGLVPLALDQCAASCEAAHAASASASEPTCHQASAPGPQVGHGPTPCGHDHNATITTVTTISVIRTSSRSAASPNGDNTNPTSSASGWGVGERKTW